MNVEVRTETPTPPQRVILDLSVEEFAMLECLRRAHLSGISLLRESLADGFAKARAGLTVENRQLLMECSGLGGRSSEVSYVFACAVSHE